MTQADYVLIESRDPFDCADTAFVADTATALAARGRAVTVYLVQNGVLAGRAGARGSQVPRLTAAGVTVLADDFSLRERGIPADRLAAQVAPAPLEAVIDRLAAGVKTLWN